MSDELEPTEPEGAAPGAPSSMPPPTGEPYVFTIAPVEPKPRRGLRRALIAAVAVLPLLGVAALAMNGISGDEAGASSPEAAVQRLADALSDEDALSALAMIPPEEAEGVRGLFETATDKLQQSRVIESKDKPFAGIDVRIENLDLASEKLADDVAVVTVNGGKLSGHTDPNDFAPRLRDAIPAEERKAETSSASVADIDRSLSLATQARATRTFVVTVKRDGRWYVSPSYTLAEYLRRGFDLPPARFDAEADGKGAESPQAAVKANLTGFTKFDIDLIRTLPPDRLRVVYDYRASIEKALENLGGSQANRFTIDLKTLDLHEQSMGANTVKVFISNLAATFDGSSAGGTTHGDVSLKGTCATTSFTATFEGESFTDGPSKGCLSDAVKGLKLNEFFVVTRQVKGKWYVDPIGTLIEYGQVFTASIEARDFDCLFAQADESADADAKCEGSLFGFAVAAEEEADFGGSDFEEGEENPIILPGD